MRIASALALVGIAAALQGKIVAERAIHTGDWSVVKRADTTEMHDVVFAVKQRNLEEIARRTIASGTPGPNYGKHLTYKEIGQLVRNDDAVTAVKDFVRSLGGYVTKTSPHGEYISARAPISVWEKVLKAEFFEYMGQTIDSRVIRSREYSMPMELSAHVEAVFNTVQMPPVRPAVMRRERLEATPTTTPQLLFDSYNIPSDFEGGLGSQAVYESLNQAMDPADLAQFQTDYNVPIDPVDVIIGGHVEEGACRNPNKCAEFSLDIQYMLAVTPNVESWTWSDESVDAFLSWAMDMVAAENAPLVTSISYGAVEPQMPTSIMKAFSTEAMKLTSRGNTIFVASGDDGVANFVARDNATACAYNPSFPGTVPWVTSVGATMGLETNTAEIACTSSAGGLVTTGGGFSSFFPMPDYQKDIVAGYFANLPADEQPVPGYNAAGHAIPTIAVAGHNYEVIVGGRKEVVSGTSASSPVAAAMAAQVNAARLAAGKSPLGFLNPAIFKFYPRFANDITEGFNNCAAGTSDIVCCAEGFYATKGFDPLTGVGSLDFAKFSEIFSNL